MKKLLPIVIAFVITFFTAFPVQAQLTQRLLPSPSPSPSQAPAVSGNFAADAEVTFVGKTASRANDFLQWTLENYNWISITANAPTDPIQEFWVLVRNIVFALLALFVLGAAFVMIITRGQNLTIMKFVPRFAMVLVLIFLSYALVRFLYQATDIIQGFFLRVQDATTGQSRLIGPQDLLYLAFDYNLSGFRLVGSQFDESAFISLLLVKLTAITYYVMTGLLLIRKIILWFFIIISPVFPLLLIFSPVRNTAKIWVGEFFRWLLYAPLFALFLHGLVLMWRDRIPLNFDFTTPGNVPGTDVTYPTAINIILGGPGQLIGINNSVNLPDTFALYVVALLMLWVVILLPFLLLQIFLDYVGNMSIAENPVYKRISSQPWFTKSFGTPPPSPGQPPLQSSPFGMARQLPFFNKRSMQTSATQNNANLNRANLSNASSMQGSRDIMRLANLSVPKMRDIARFETSMMKHDTVSRQEVSRFHDTLEKISAPRGTIEEREKYSNIKSQLVTQAQGGDHLANSILSALKVAEEEKDKTKAVRPGEKTDEKAKLTDVKLPEENKVQQVSIEEYEEVKKMWQENYQNMDSPVGPDGNPIDKNSFIQQDIEKITETINLLSSQNQDDVKKGMEHVSNVLPFLLIGGFSKVEVVGYLKAKLEAAKSVLGSLSQKKEEEDTMVERQEGQAQAQNTMVMREEIKPDEDKNGTNGSGGQTPPVASGQ